LALRKKVSEIFKAWVVDKLDEYKAPRAKTRFAMDVAIIDPFDKSGNVS
jgi:hypothetical protein